MSKSKVRLDVFLNNGKKEDGKRIVLNIPQDWESVLKKVSEKMKCLYSPNCLIYSEAGSPFSDIEEFIDGESVYYEPNGQPFLPIASTPMDAVSPTSPKAIVENNLPTQALVPDVEKIDQSIYHYTMKYIIVGSTAVGKSCLLLQFTDKRFRDTAEPTIGVDFGTSVVMIREEPIKLQIWDTAGQEDFRAITRAYYREAAGALLVYDVSNKTSYKKLGSWLSSVKKNATNDNIVIFLIGNKCDVPDNRREVTYEEGEKFANENGLLFCETSAREGTNVNLAFIRTAEEIYDRVKNGIVDPSKSESGVKINAEYTGMPKSNNNTPSVTPTNSFNSKSNNNNGIININPNSPSNSERKKCC